MVRLVVAALLLALTSSLAQAAARPDEPALFVVQGSDTTIYLFGTFHALDGRSPWLDDRIRSAFEQSDELVLETLVPEQRTGTIPSSVRLRPPSITPSASFLATARMAIDAGASRGMEVGNGADMVLRRMAEAEGKEVEGLETLQLQINMFNHMPAPAAQPRRFEVKGPLRPDPMAGLSEAMAQMQDAWKRGDQSVFVNMLEQLETQSPGTYRLMFAERNTRWADWIRARMQTPGVVFVAVGAGHLAGKDSLLVRLAERGLPSRRVY